MRRQYWWIATHEEGKPYLILATGCNNESEARQYGMETLGGLDFEIKQYPTRDRNQASAYYRGKRLTEGVGLHKASQRIGHNKSLKRMLKRRL